MYKDKLKGLAAALGIGVVVGSLSWCLVSFTGPCTIASAITYMLKTSLYKRYIM